MDEIVIVLASFVFIIGYFGIFDKLLSKLHSAIFITIWLSILSHLFDVSLTSTKAFGGVTFSVDTLKEKFLSLNTKRQIFFSCGNDSPLFTL